MIKFYGSLELVFDGRKRASISVKDLPLVSGRKYIVKIAHAKQLKAKNM